MGSLFTNGGRIKDVIGHASYHGFLIIIISGKIGNIKIWP
jgi:hypothetical protein